MKSLLNSVRAAIGAGKDGWALEGEHIVVHVPGSGRRHRVRLSRREDLYVLWAVILPSAEVTATDDRWRAIAYQAWRRNAMTELVTFAFDEHDRLIGVVEVPVVTLDHEELVAYVDALARECDRFEFALSGRDQE